MPKIKGREAAVKTIVGVKVKLTQHQAETLAAYAAWIGEEAAYVVGQLIEQELVTDKEFQAARGSGGHAKAATRQAPLRVAAAG